MKKLLLIIVVLTAMCTNSFALQVQNHFVDMEVDEKGLAKIVEKYNLQFEDINEIDFFTQRTQVNSSSLLAWRSDYEFFYPHFESADNRLTRSSVTFEQETNTLILEYELAKPLMTIISDEPRETKFGFSAKQLNNYLNEGLVVIPENTVINITLPRNSQILGQSILPQIEINNNTITIKPITTSGIKLEYTLTKPIQTRVNSLELIQQFFSNSSNIIVILIALAIITGFFWKREKIKERIENYIVDHSEIEHSEAEQEIDLQA